MMLLLKKYYCILFSLLLCGAGYSQDPVLKVNLNSKFFTPTDTVQINAKITGENVPAATLYLLAEHEDGMAWEFRWPLLNGEATAALIIPDSFPQGQFRLQFSVLKNLFTLFGKVMAPEKLTKISSTLLTANGDYFERESRVEKDGSFIYKNVIFENEASLIFGLPKADAAKMLHIEISTILDSVYHSNLEDSIDIFIGDKEPENGLKPFTSSYEDIHPRAKILEAVTVYTKAPDQGKLYDDVNSSAMFKDPRERILNLIDKPQYNNAFSILQLLSTRVPGLIINRGAFAEASWRGSPVSFYLDEMRVTINDIDNFPITDVAIIKTIPPPFMGNIAGSGGAVIVYTKKGGPAGTENKNSFKVKGYSPAVAYFPLIPHRH